MPRPGLVEVYTGDGKGKTTAAFGLALRALGRGLRVLLVQFLKPSGFDTGEANMAVRLGPGLTLRRFDEQWNLGSFQREEDRMRMRSFFAKVMPELEQVVKRGEYDLVIFDEINQCLAWQLIELKEVLQLVENKAANVELVFTGRDAPDELIERADLVTFMKMVKHPYNQGIKARKGIEY